VINATTAGVGAPVASTAEDIGSIVMSLLAILLPILVLLGLVLLVSSSVWAIRRRRQRKRERRPVEGVTTERLFG
jgi:heme/copper-type cytochrome/quinol oxidase subunit 2